MAKDRIQPLIAERLGGARFGKGTKIYKFEKIKRAKAQAAAAHPGETLIDLGVGEPDEMAFPGVVETLRREAADPENRGYADNGIQAFKDAASRYMERVFGVAGIDPASEVLHSIGAKPALAMIPAIFIDPNDVCLMTVPGYPVMATHAAWYGGKVHPLPLEEKNDFLPDLDKIPAAVLRRAKLLYLNYPNNPTGAVATPEFFSRAVALAKKHGIAVVHDAAYAALNFEERPLSFLSVPGAKEVGVEIHSLSKAFNMTGWRLAFVAGNAKMVQAFAVVKDNVDSGQFKAIQKSGIAALDHPEISRAIAAKYARRMRGLVDALNAVGFRATMPKGSFFLYAAAPKGIRGGPAFKTAEEASQYLITEKLISTVPWDDVGRYLRFSVTFVAAGEDEERRILNLVKERLGGVDWIF